MIIDSSDDEPEQPKQPVYQVSFEDDCADVDNANPFPEILTYIDIDFGTEATELAVCDKVEGKIVVGAACADSTVRLVTLPLTPPGPEQSAAAKDKKKGSKWNETIHVLSGFSMSPDLVAITYQKSTATHAFPTLLIASHSREVTGLLLLHTVPVDAKDGKPTYSSAAAGHSSSQQAQYLPSPASSLNFNDRNSTLLLGFKSGCVRLYSPATSTWLLTLHTPFSAPAPSASPSSSHSTRKAVLDAKWVLNSKAIAVLLSDGEWGIWDIYGAGPSSSKSILSRGGIKGGTLTPFSLGGYIDGPPAKSSHKTSTISTQSKFAPMTPATRKTVDLAAAASRSGLEGGNATNGRINVLPLSRNETTAPRDDQVAFWIEDSFAVIHSLRGHWEAKSKKGGSLFGGGNSQSRLERVEGVNLRGEKCSGMTQVDEEFVRLGDEMVVVGEHRIVFVRDREDQPNRNTNRVSPFMRSEAEEYEDVESTGGLEDLDRSLDLMEERRVASSGANFGQSFGTSQGSGYGQSFKRSGRSGFGDGVKSLDFRA